VKRSIAKLTVSCSKSCRQESAKPLTNLKDNKKTEQKPCVICGTDVLTLGKGSRRLYCSKQCKGMGLSSDRTPFTEEEQKIIKALILKKASQKYIAGYLGRNLSQVRRFLKSNGLSTAKFYRKTNTQQKFYEDVPCLICGEARVVEKAHIIPARSGGPDTLENIMPLCPTHHALFDKDKLYEEEKIKITHRITKAFELYTNQKSGGDLNCQ